MKKILFILAAVALLTGCAGTYFTFDNARQVKIGMSASDVEKILGKPYMVTTQSTNDIWVYSFAEGFAGTSKSVSYVFTDGKVTEVPRIPKSFK